MITALIIMHLFGGGSIDFFSRSHFSAVESAVEDPSRAAAATRAMERINENLVDVLEYRKTVFAELVELNRAIDTPEDAFDEVLDGLWQYRREARQKYIQDVFIMRRIMTRQEWDTAFGDTEG